MKFDDFDARMRIYETARDQIVPPGLYLAARLDGRNFSRLTKEICDFEAPFDVRFRDLMAETVKHLMTCGFTVVYGYTESDEISLLFDLNENAFGRKHRKINSVLAGEASAKFSLMLGRLAAFDCRVIELPNLNLVVDYFRWRASDAHRNALNAHCYWRLRADGLSERAAAARLEGLSVAAKNEFLFNYGVNFNDFPAWQKRGMGFYWGTADKEGSNPKTGEKTTASRRVIEVNYELPLNDDYAAFIASLIESGNSSGGPRVMS